MINFYLEKFYILIQSRVMMSCVEAWYGLRFIQYISKLLIR